MQNIQIEDSTKLRLFERAKSFDTTPDRIINDALDALEKQPNEKVLIQNEGKNNRLQFESKEIPDLTLSKLLGANIAGKVLHPSKWVDLWDPILTDALEKGLNLIGLDKLYGLELILDPESMEQPQYFHYIPILKKWLRQKSANSTVAIIKKIAVEFQIEVSIEIKWKQREKALHPGQQAMIQIN